MLGRHLQRVARGRELAASTHCACPAVCSPSTSYAIPQRNARRTQCRSATLQTSEAASAVAIPVFPAPAAGRFVNNNTSFKEEHRIRGYEVTPNQQASIPTIANLLQEVAGNHAVGMWGRTDSGFASLPSTEFIFVMTRLQIRMHKYPRWGDVVACETYFTEEGRLAARRDWRITNAVTGELLGAATSTWVTINMATRRIAKIPDDLKKRFMQLTPPASQVQIPPEQTKQKLPDIILPGELRSPSQVARRSDMDMNGHINNVLYLAWALESVPNDVYNDMQLYEVEVDFKAECQAGNTVEAHSFRLPPVAEDSDAAAAASQLQLLHSLQRCDESGTTAELVRARTTWRPRT